MTNSEKNPQRPQYGEMAPEGWQWQPPTADDRSPNETGQTTGTTGNPVQNGGNVTGVPHNLGIDPRAGARPGAAPQQPASTQPLAAPENRVATGAATPQMENTPPQAPASPPAAPPVAAPAVDANGVKVLGPVPDKPRKGDRIVTIILLVIGALSALMMASSCAQMPTVAHLFANSVPEGYTATVPDYIATLSIAGVVTVLLLWVIALVWSIARMRQHKLAFWIPLVAGIIAVIVTSVISYTVMMGTVPAEVMQDPQLMQQMIDTVYEEIQSL